MKNLFFFGIILTVLVIIGGVLLNEVKKEKTSQASFSTTPVSYEYFWSETCPHCANVAKFMDSWEKDSPAQAGKISLEKYEVNKSAEARNRFMSRGKFCNIAQNELGVPLLVTPQGECLLGDEPIINYFKNLEL